MGAPCKARCAACAGRSRECIAWQKQASRNQKQDAHCDGGYRLSGHGDFHTASRRASRARRNGYRRAVDACRRLGRSVLVRHKKRSCRGGISGSSPGRVRRNRDSSTAGMVVGRDLQGAVEDGFSLRRQLHQQVEVSDVAAEHGAAMLERAEKDKGVVHGSAAVLVPGVPET
jgi:hypothetical protein